MIRWVWDFRLVLQLALWLVLFLSSVRTQAQTSTETPVHLYLQECDIVSPEILSGLVALELSPRPVQVMDQTDSKHTSGGGTVARVRCERDRATLVVQDIHGGESLSLELELQSTADVARPRLLALTLAELIVSSRMGQMPPSEESSPFPERMDDVQTANAESGVRLFFGPGAVFVGQPTMLSLLVEVGSQVMIGPLCVMALLQWDRGERVQGTDEASAWTLSAALVAAATLRVGMFEPLLGLGFRGGYAQLAGSSSRPEVDGKTLAGFWLAPLGTAALQSTLTDAVGARIGLELGYVLTPLRGVGIDEEDTHLVYAFEGLRLSTSIALLVSL